MTDKGNAGSEARPGLSPGQLHQISASLGRETARDTGADVEHNKLYQYGWAHHQVSGRGEKG